MNTSKKQALTLIRLIGDNQCTVTEQGGCLLTADKGEAARIDVRDARFYRAVLGGSIPIARAYLDGWWDTPDLYALMVLAAKNTDSVNAHMDSGWRRLPLLFMAMLSAMRRRLLSRKSAKTDITAHYDLSNNFFSLFLDETLAYSCAVFPDLNHTDSDNLQQASQNKLEKICDKLELTQKDTLMDLGCGWGSMAFHAAARRQCAVTALTLSAAQHHYISAVDVQKTHAPIQTVLSDYRDFTPTKKFDKLLSVEMIEAVGEKHFNTYFRRIREFLSDNGIALVQAITIPDARYRAARRTPDFIREYVFPGGMLPSPSIIQHAANKAGLHLIETEDISAHYAPTLLAWRTRFNQQRTRIKALGFSERFCRLWEYYFCYCAGSFSAGVIGVAQITLAPSRR